MISDRRLDRQRSMLQTLLSHRGSALIVVDGSMSITGGEESGVDTPLFGFTLCSLLTRNDTRHCAFFSFVASTTTVHCTVHTLYSKLFIFSKNIYAYKS